MPLDCFILKLQKAPKALNCPNLAPKGSWPGFGPKGFIPKLSRSKFHLLAGKSQIGKSGSKRLLARIWFQKSPFPSFPEANFQSQLASPKVAKSGSKRLLARIWPKEGIFPRFPEENFNSQLASPNLPKSGSKSFPPAETCDVFLNALIVFSVSSS